MKRMFRGNLAVLRVLLLATLPTPFGQFFCPRQGTASGRLTWGGICENGVLGVADSQFSVPE